MVKEFFHLLWGNSFTKGAQSPYGVLIRKQESLLGSRRRQEDNIKMNIQEIVYEGVDWIHLAQRFVAILINSTFLLVDA
jgi:hypothetical protein